MCTILITLTKYASRDVKERNFSNQIPCLYFNNIDINICPFKAQVLTLVILHHPNRYLSS